MSGNIQGSTHYAMSGAMDSSPVDQHLIRPRSSSHGLRTISMTYGAVLPDGWRTSPGWKAGQYFAHQAGVKVDAQRVDSSGSQPRFLFRFASGVVPNEVAALAGAAAKRYGALVTLEDRYAVFESPEEIVIEFGGQLPADWRSSSGWRAGSFFARQAGDLVNASKIDTSGHAPAFLFRVAPGVNPDDLRALASRSAGQYGAFFRVASNHVAFTSEAPPDLIVGEAMEFGKLYPGSSYASPVPSSPADPSVLVTRSGGSGYRGAKDPFTSSLTGADAVPKPDYQKFGGDVPLKTAPQLENTINAGALFFAATGVALLYRALGGAPIG